MTGWRLGWATGNRDVLAALRRVKTFFDSGSYLGIQAAGAAVLGAPDAAVAATVQRIRERRDAAVAAFRAAGLEVQPPRATLYLWLPVPGRETSETFCSRLLHEAHVVLLPGSAMGAGGEGYVRASLTLEPEEYERVAHRIRRVL